MNDLEEEAIGPGADLAISLAGVLIVLLVGSFFFWNKLAISRDWFKDMLQMERLNVEKATDDLVSVEAELFKTSAELQKEKAKSVDLRGSLSEAESKLGNVLISLEERDDIVSEAARLSIENTDMAEEITKLEKLVDYFGVEVEKLTAENNRLQAQGVNANQVELEELRRKVKILEQGSRSDQPPFINIDAARQQLFKTGSAALNPEFQLLLETKIADEIADLAINYGAQVIEVVGHTDEVPISQSPDNHIDSKLLAVLNGGSDLSEIVPRSNMDLGMARAVAVALVLGDDPDLSALTIRPMSAGQSTLPDDQIATRTSSQSVSDSKRRRIEIRVRRRSEVQTIK